MKYSFIVAFKNRDKKRARLFLESVQMQTITDFELIFVNQGSDEDVNFWLEALLPEFTFVKYIHSRSEGLFWNKSNALNIGIKAAKGEYIIVADIDLIYHSNYLLDINKLIKPGLFLTHSVFYISELFSLNNVDDIARLPVNQYEESFHGACVAKKEVLFKIGGYDEFYIGWGGEDDDIIRRLEGVGEMRKHISATEICLFHQWHPIVSPRKPSPWYLLMVNHLFTKKDKSYSDASWGLTYTFEERPVLKLIAEGSYKDKVRVEFWYNQVLLFFNPFIEQFHELKKGQIAYLEYTYIPEPVRRKIFFSTTKKNNVNTMGAERITKKDISDFFQFFIGMNSGSLRDYFYAESTDNFTFVFIKK